MSIYSNAQICGTDSPVKVYRINGGADIFISIGERDSSVTMNPPALRQMLAALETFEASENEAAK